MSEQRKYSVAEVDRMRVALTVQSMGGPGVEDRLRTYMLNGTDPEELEAWVETKVEAERQRREEISAIRRQMNEIKDKAREAWSE